MSEVSLQHLIDTFAMERERLQNELKECQLAYSGLLGIKHWHEWPFQPSENNEYEVVLNPVGTNGDSMVYHLPFRDGKWKNVMPGFEVAFWREIPDWPGKPHKHKWTDENVKNGQKQIQICTKCGERRALGL